MGATSIMLLAGKRALLLEDDGLIAANTGSDLAEVGAVVDTVATCSDGLRLLGEQAFDFAVLDIKLVDETSYALASELRHRGVPFLFISGYDRTRNDFADAVLLQKPFSRDALLGAIMGLIGEEKDNERV
jgi:DNA-binding response OmpR family regulator